MYRSLFTHRTKCNHLPRPTHVLKAYRSAQAQRPREGFPGSRTSSTKWNAKATGSRPAARQPPHRTLPSGHPIQQSNHDPLGASFMVEEALEPSEVVPYLRKAVRPWSELLAVRERLTVYGIPREDVQPLLEAFAEYMESHDIFSDLKYSPEHVDSIGKDFADPQYNVNSDVQLTRLLYEWAFQPTTRTALEGVVSPSTLLLMSDVYQATDLSDPAGFFEVTRTAPRRKVIMHVGPTNSGKTHHALRALAASKNGAYAGPLRLLAHEIWDRLNKGQIVPQGMDVEGDVEEDPDINVDAAVPGQTPAVQKHANKGFARVCNLITGDDRRILDEHAPLLSCTVEMLGSNKMLDVAVVDEIQLIADSERGGAWTTAVLGINARELHLCGEETAVPVVQKLLEETGDELVVNRYQRLTPLKVADASLGGDYSKMQKGDCFVTFSRAKIFKARERIEATSGLRCAVAYGNLPPEVRSQQAGLFNDTSTDYDVLVGSDAVGMGLNLKIKRMILEKTSKWDGKEDKHLSLSQIKQIAGRAGRFGLHGSDSSGGVVTTMHDKDLPLVHAAISAPMEPLRKARILPPFDMLRGVVAALPPDTPLAIVPWVFHYVGKHHPMFALVDPEKSCVALAEIDAVAQGTTLRRRSLFHLAPIRWRDPVAMEAAQVMMRLCTEQMHVPHLQLLRLTGLMDTVNDMRSMMRQGRSKLPFDILSKLESIHGVLVAYLWLHFRMPIPFSDQAEVHALKEEIEAAMQWYLAKMSAMRNKPQSLGRKFPSASSPVGYDSGQKRGSRPYSPPLGSKAERVTLHV